MDLLGVAHIDGSYQLKRGDAFYPITQDNVPVRSLLPGWQASYGVADDDIPTVLSLCHDNGQRAVWYLDRHQRFMANAAADLPEAQRIAIEQLAHRQVAQIGAALVLGLVDAYAPSDAEASFATAIAHDRGLFDGLLPRMCPRAGSVVLEDAGGSRRPEAEPAIARACGHAVSVEALSSFFRQDLLAVQIDAVRDRHLTMPSPLDGAPLKSSAAWCLEPTDGFAYHFRAPVPQDSFFVVMYGFEMTIIAVYFPAHNLFIHLSEHHRGLTQRFLGAEPEGMLWRHAFQHAVELGAYSRAAATPVLVCSYEHVGHHLWNELTGIHETIRRTEADRLPSVIVVNPSGTELYGKIDEIFPELAGKVSRHDTIQALTKAVYDGCLLPLRPTGSWVSRDLAERISRRAERTYMTPATECVLDGLRAKGFRVLLLGLRVENRTVVDFPAFCEELIVFLAAELGKIAVIIDGQNRSDDGHVYRVTLQGGRDELPLQMEQDIVDGLSRRFADDPNIVVISTIGSPVGVSVALAARAEFFVTPWGAGLAKYRWVCNRPGLVLAGPSCERLQPVHLYDDPVFMEAPAPIYFMHPGDIQDAPDDPLMFEGGNNDRVNIRVDRDALHARLRDLLRELPPRDAA